jgi:hypothetical protein
MKLEWKKLHRELRLFGIALMLSLGVLSVVWYFYQQADQQYRQASNQLSQAQMRYQQANDKKQLLEVYEKRFKALQKQNVFGEEQRIDWIENLQASSDRHKIPSVKFELSQRTMLDSAELGELGSGLSAYYSKMELDMSLLHEGDLFALLSDLDTYAKGLNAAQKCQLKKEPGGLAAGVSGRCELYWYTFSEPREIIYDENGNPVPQDDMTAMTAEGNP